MSFRKDIEKKESREHRRPWTYAKEVAPSCRNHGGCPWCEGNRLYKTHKEEERTKNWKKELEG